jgi:hypothetical protein
VNHTVTMMILSQHSHDCRSFPRPHWLLPQFGMWTGVLVALLQLWLSSHEQRIASAAPPSFMYDALFLLCLVSGAAGGGGRVSHGNFCLHRIFDSWFHDQLFTALPAHISEGGQATKWVHTHTNLCTVVLAISERSDHLGHPPNRVTSVILG